MKLSKLFMVLGASLALSFTSQAQIQVPNGGVGPITFPVAPPVTEWSTYSVGTAAGTFTTATALDASVIANVNSTLSINALATSTTFPPSQNGTARHNSNTGAPGTPANTAPFFLQTRPTGVDYLVMMATLRNTSGQAVPNLIVRYDWSQYNPIPVAEEIPGHRVYYSLTGAPGSWTLVPGLSTFTVNDSFLALQATLSLGNWPDQSLLYLIWVDDNGSGSTTDPQEGAYGLDNFVFTPQFVGDPVTVTVTSPTNTQRVVQSANLQINTTTTGIVRDVDFVLDGVTIGKDTTPAYSTNISTAGLSLGNHTIQAIAYETGGTPHNSTIITFTVVANTAPVLSITNTFTTNVVNGRINNGPYLVGSFVTVQATNFDDVAITNVDWYVDNVLYVRRAGASTGFTYNDSRAGSHMIYGIASDAGGLTTQSATVGISVTNLAPNFVPLIPNGSTWRTYSGGTAPPLDNISFAWYQTGYDMNGAWSNLVAEIGNGDATDGYPETSLVDIGPAATRYRTVWFRKEFPVTNPAQYQNFLLRLLRDDGAVVFINDTPVWTNNMALPLGDNGLFPNDFSTNFAAIAAPDDGTLYQDFSLDPANYPGLLNANFTVGIEVHQNAINSSDLSFDFMLFGVLATPPSVSITSPTNSQSFRQGDSATVTVLASTFVTNVNVFLDGILQGSDGTAPFSVVVSNLPVGSHNLTATGKDSLNNPLANSAVVTINVIANQAPTAVAVTNLIDGTNLLVGGFLINVGATATDDGGVARVEFYDNGVLRATDTTSPYAAALMVDFTVGTHQITARAFDGAGLSTLSAPVTVNVTNPPALTAVLTNRADWKYFVPAADVAGWFTSGFPDGSWAVGPAKFGFGGDGETTVLDRTNLVTGVTNVGFYFRKQITLTAPQLASFGSIPLWLNRDDGAVVYVNGTEVYRVKMTTNAPAAPAYNALADAPAVGGNDENTFFVSTNLPTSVFSAGLNTIAVEVHQDSPTSSDISFDLMLWGAVAGGPTLTIVLQPNGDVTVSWAGGGTLIGTDDPTTPRASWTTVPGASPVNIAAGSLLAKRFYAVRVP